VLGTYQQTLSGVSAHVTVAQPLIFFSLPHGYYLRSSAAMTFDTGISLQLPSHFTSGWHLF
jgi:hypothetical protein